MTSGKENLRAKVHPLFIGYVAILGIIDGPAMMCGFLIALIVHESAHLFAGALLHEPFEHIQLTPFGGALTYQSGKSACKGVKGIVIASAGPLGNYAAILLLAQLSMQQRILYDVQRAAIIVNTSMLLVNLLPVLPLDGGRIIFSIGYYLFPVTSLIAVLSLLGMSTGLLMVLLAAYGVSAVGTLNISLLMIGIYITICAKKGKQALLANEFYTILCERVSRRKSTRPVRLYAVNEETDLFSFVPLLCKPGDYVCLIGQENSRCVIGEEKLIQALFDAPHQPVGALFDIHC